MRSFTEAGAVWQEHLVSIVCCACESLMLSKATKGLPQAGRLDAVQL